MSIDCKIAALSILSKICQNSFSLADIFQLHKYQVLALINVPAIRKRKQGSGKLRVWKVLVVKWRSLQFSSKFKKYILCLHLKEISPDIFFKTFVVQN